ncbi:MAG: hypothetical protein MHPSP_002680 [Paramarteilia canceri]
MEVFYEQYYSLDGFGKWAGLKMLHSRRTRERRNSDWIFALFGDFQWNFAAFFSDKQPGEIGK